jgi:peroxiredoxin
MKKNYIFLVVIIIVIVAVGGWYLSGSKQPSSALRLPTVGSQAPDFQLVDTRGEIHTLKDLRGKVVLVNFWATWCPPCRAEMPSMEDLYRTYGQDDFEILAINVDDNGPEVMPGFLKKTPHTFPILFDTEFQAQNLYGVSMFPETFIVDKNGVIVKKVIGAIDWTAPKILNELKFLIED